MKTMIHQVIQTLHFMLELINLLFLYDFFIFFQVKEMLSFDKATYLSLLCKFILSERLIHTL